MKPTRPYCTVAQVRTLLENPDADAAILAAAITSASRAIDEKLGRDFWFHDHSSTAYRVPAEQIAGNILLLPFPIITLTEVTSGDEVLTEGDEGDYTYIVGRQAIYAASTWSGVIRVKGTFGYALATTEEETTPPPTLPEPVSTAAKVIAATYSGLWRKARVSPLGGVEEMETVSVVPGSVWKSIARYSIRDVGSTF